MTPEEQIPMPNKNAKPDPKALLLKLLNDKERNKQNGVEPPVFVKPNRAARRAGKKR
jgi:hypothetical protein